MQKLHDTDPRVRQAMRQLDVPLLELFETVHRLRNLTAAGERLALSQPAVSRGLAKLREVYGDSLFVRQHRGVAPTPLADALAGPLSAALDTLRSTMLRPAFEPGTSRRIFHVAVSDVGERLFLPRLQRHLAHEAPGVSLHVVSPTLEELQAGLASGAIDMAAGFVHDLGKQVHHQRLFRERFVYVARTEHPELRGRIDKEQQRRLGHVLAGPPGTEHAAAVEKVLTSARVRARVVLRVHSFLCVAPIVAGSDLIAAVPSNLAASTAEHMNLQILEPPVALPSFEVSLVWHQRFHRDPANQWLRHAFMSLFTDYDRVGKPIKGMPVGPA